MIFKNHKKLIIIVLPAVIVVLLPFIVFFLRSPVLIVTEQAFVLLYGEERIKSETLSASFSLFRRVKTAAVANDSGDEIVPFLINEISKKPYCVVFPLRFVKSANIYHASNPEIPIIILGGRENNALFSALEEDSTSYFIYKTDLYSDFYRAAIAAVAIDNRNNKKTAVFLDSALHEQANEAFLQALADNNNDIEAVFFASWAQFSEIDNYSCVIMAGFGNEFFDRKSEIPVILFSWLDTTMIPADTALVFNDSPWAQLVRAVRMSASGQRRGNISSQIIVINSLFFDRGTLRKIR